MSSNLFAQMEAARERIESNKGAIKRVIVSDVSNSAQLLAELNNTAVFPLAAVTFTGTDYSTRSAEQSLRLAVFVAAQWQKNDKDRLAGGLALAEQVAELFRTGDQFDFLVQSIVPVEGTELISVYAVNLTQQGVL